MKIKLIFILICFALVSLSLILNLYLKGFNISDNELTMQMNNSNIYFYNKDKLVLNYFSEKTNIDYNWNKFEFLNNKGQIDFKHNNYTFNATSMVYKNRRKNLIFNDILIKLNENSNLKFKSGQIDLNNMTLMSNEKIIYKNKNILGTSQGCFANLNKKNIQLYNTHLEF